MSHMVKQPFVSTVGFTVLLFLCPTPLTLCVICCSLKDCTRGVHLIRASMLTGLVCLGDRVLNLNLQLATTWIDGKVMFLEFISQKKGKWAFTPMAHEALNNY